MNKIEKEWLKLKIAELFDIKYKINKIFNNDDIYKINYLKFILNKYLYLLI